ncbi:hypothetical protein [Paludibaculum fermentans]|uniref:Uncharacterized protein n=1 Tax=Paludibaculum fermentans TaxID=1473598 RepID=A0A7S7SME6_PALFE|nr:hypothetical protein [Paludibaculum fermentans]QOY89828.1 hypothetical protein IRI77_07710 [Paludibaculum fermentans]
MAAASRSLLLFSAGPLWLLSAVCCFWLWPWRAAAGHLAILGGLALLWSILLSVMYERQALAEPRLFVPALPGLAVVWACLRWRTAAHAREEGAEVRFEELASPAVQVLGLDRDGEWATPSNQREP